MIGDKWGVYLAVTACAALFVVDALFEWGIFARRRRWVSDRPRYSLIGRVFRVLAGGMVLLAMLQLGVREVIALRRARTLAAADLGWNPGQPVKLSAGEILQAAAVADDGSLAAVVSFGAFEKRGLWLHRLDAAGKRVPSFGTAGRLDLTSSAPGARAVAFAPTTEDLYVAAGLSSPHEYAIDFVTLSGSGRERTRLRMAVPVPNAKQSVAAAGDVAIAVDLEGRAVVVGRADAPGAGAARLAAFRIEGGTEVDPHFGGELRVLPVKANAKVSLARGPAGELYVSTSDGLRTWLLRLTSEGRPDPSFGEDGMVELGECGYSSVIATPAGLVAAGYAGGYRLVLWRVGYDGEIDQSFASALRKTPLQLRDREATHPAGMVYVQDSLWVALYSADNATGRQASALSERGELDGPPVWLHRDLPDLPKVAARGLWRLGSDRLLVAIEGGPAFPATAREVSARTDLYFRPVALSLLTFRADEGG